MARFCAGRAGQAPRLGGSVWATAPAAARARRAGPGQVPLRTPVISCQENRSFDHYFGSARQVQAKAYGPPPGYTQPDGAGGSIAPYELSALRTADLSTPKGPGYDTAGAPAHRATRSRRRATCWTCSSSSSRRGRFPMHQFKRVTMAAAAIAATVGATVAMADPAPARHDGAAAHGRYAIALFGDMPYNAGGRAEYPRLIDDVNHAHVAFSAFDGDLKAGADGACTDELYTQSLAWFNRFKRPVVITPGDNDWTDCWGRYGPGTGGFDPEERLDFERQLFFATDQSLGRHTMTVERESSEPGYSDYREDARWIAGPVLYLTLNVQGSNDNLPHAGVDGETRPADEIARQAAEHAARERANIHWLDESYALAEQRDLKGVMVIWQADPDFNNEQKLQPEQYDGYAEIVPALRRDVLDFPGQSVLVHGDSHYFKLDKPLNYDNGQVITKFTRVETFGAANTHWVQAAIDPSDPNLFEFVPRIVAGNVDDR